MSNLKITDSKQKNETYALREKNSSSNDVINKCRTRSSINEILDDMGTNDPDYKEVKKLSKMELLKKRKLAKKKKLKLEAIENLKQAKILREINNQEGTCVRFRSRSAFGKPSAKESVLRTNDIIGRSILKPNAYSKNYKECTYNHNHGRPMGIWSENVNLCKKIKKKDIPYFADFPSTDFLKKSCCRRKNIQCAFKKYKMPGCDCQACWEHRLQPGPTACLPVPPCERDHVDDIASPHFPYPPGFQQHGAGGDRVDYRGRIGGGDEARDLETHREPIVDSITQFVKGIGSRAIARLLGRAEPVDVHVEDGLQPWQKYAAATAMSDATRPAMIEEMDGYTRYGSPYGNPVAQLEHDQYYQNDITTHEVPHTRGELAARRGRGRTSGGVSRTLKRSKGRGRACVATDTSGRFVNDKVREVETSKTSNDHLSIAGQFMDAFRDKPSEYEVELMAAEAADMELERREAVANGEIDNIDPTADECIIM